MVLTAFTARHGSERAVRCVSGGLRKLASEIGSHAIVSPKAASRSPLGTSSVVDRAGEAAVVVRTVPRKTR